MNVSPYKHYLLKRKTRSRCVHTLPIKERREERKSTATGPTYCTPPFCTPLSPPFWPHTPLAPAPHLRAPHLGRGLTPPQRPVRSSVRHRVIMRHARAQPRALRRRR